MEYIYFYIFIYIYILEWARTYPCAELAALPFIVLTFVDSIQPLFTGFVFAFVSYFVSAVGSSHSKQIAWIRKQLVSNSLEWMGFEISWVRLRLATSKSIGFESLGRFVICWVRIHLADSKSARFEFV